jgi:predicted nucleic acid-binding protein
LYLVDTNIVSGIVSAGAPAKRRVGYNAFAAWMRAQGDRLHISTITVAEIEAGIARAIRIGAAAKAERLRRWLDALEHFYEGRILPFGIEEARQAGAILDRARAHDPGFEDIAIAATAAVRGFTILTANERHFAPLGVAVVNPLKELS